MAPYSGQVAKRRALPLDRAVRWLPLDDAYYLLAEVMTSTRAVPLVVMQEALLRMEAHASSEVYGSTCGVLCGAQYRDPKSGATYLLVEGIERAVRLDLGGDPDASLAADLSKAIASAERTGRTVVGWYRFDVALSHKIPATDAGIHRSLFPEPWQVALLRDGADGEGTGAFIRVEPTEGRAFPIPFFELIPRRRSRARGSKRTSIEWSNYTAESPVVPLPVDAFRDVSPPRPKPAPSKLVRTSRPRRSKLLTDVLGEWPLRSVPRRPPDVPRESEAPERTPFAPRESEAPERTPFAPRAGPPPEKTPYAPLGGPSPERAPFAPLGGASPERPRFAPLAQGGLRASSDTLVKGAIGVAAVLVVTFFMARGDASSSYAGVAADSGEVATAAGVARGDGSGGDGTGAANPGTGPFTAGERARVWSALAAVAARRTNLAARLDTLDDALLAARSGGDRTVPCARAAALYQSALGDRAKIDAARRELTQLVGPMRMAGVDSLAERTTAMQRSIEGSCR